MSSPQYGPGIEITGRITPEYAQILAPEAMALAAAATSCSRSARCARASSTPARCPISCL